MPVVRFEGQEIACERGERLRSVLLRAGLTPHNGPAKSLNCRGFGTCGTCAVRVEGLASEMGPRERARLRVPPHSMEAGLRLACLTKIEDDLTVTKFEGFWGQDITQARRPA